MSTASISNLPDSAIEASDAGELLDTLPEAMFDGIVRLAAQALHTPLAFFTILDEHRVWFKARYGSDHDELDQLDLPGSFCDQTVREGIPLVVTDAAADLRFCTSSIVAGEPHVRFYAGVPIRSTDGTIVGTLCVLDTSPREMAPDDLLTLQGFARDIEARVALRAARIVQQRLLDERAILMNMILHDARGILGSLRWSLDLLEDDVSAESELLVHARRAVDELLRLCNGISGLGDPAATRVVIDPKPEDLHRWFELLGRRATRLASKRGLTLVVDNQLPSGRLTADVHVLDRVLMNLIRNACAACEGERGSSLLVEAVVTGGNDIRFTVSDDGPGVPEEIRERIFEPYFTHHESGGAGTGLGLAFGRLAARALGGSLSYRPRDPKGAEFVLTVPLGGGVSNGV